MKLDHRFEIKLYHQTVLFHEPVKYHYSKTLVSASEVHVYSVNVFLPSKAVQVVNAAFPLSF